MKRAFLSFLITILIGFSVSACSFSYTYKETKLEKKYVDMQDAFFSEIIEPKIGQSNKKDLTKEISHKVSLFYGSFGVFKDVELLCVYYPGFLYYDHFISGIGSLNHVYDANTNESVNFELPLIYNYYLFYNNSFNHTPQSLVDNGILSINDLRLMMKAEPKKRIEPLTSSYLGFINQTFDAHYNVKNTSISTFFLKETIIQKELPQTYEDIKKKYFNNAYYFKNEALEYSQLSLNRVYDVLPNGAYLLHFSICSMGIFDGFGGEGGTFFYFENKQLNAEKCFIGCSRQLPKVFYEDNFYYLQEAFDLNIITAEDISSWTSTNQNYHVFD